MTLRTETLRHGNKSIHDPNITSYFVLVCILRGFLARGRLASGTFCRSLTAKRNNLRFGASIGWPPGLFFGSVQGAGRFAVETYFDFDS